MTYGCSNAGRLHEDPSDAGRVEFWAFRDVEDRLVEAMTLWRRSPDREHGWLHVKAFWPEVRRFGWTTAVGGEFDHPEQEPQTRAPRLTRLQVQQMNDAADWLLLVPERDRRLVALAVARLASGAKQVPWGELKPALGVQFGAHGLRKRYSRAITGIANALNARNSAKIACQDRC
jgi:hypothetical protein